MKSVATSSCVSLKLVLMIAVLKRCYRVKFLIRVVALFHARAEERSDGRVRAQCLC